MLTSRPRYFRAARCGSSAGTAIDSYQQSLATYRQTVLSGLAQVADTLRALQHDATHVEAQSRQETVADVQYNQASIARIEGQAQRPQETVGLLVALGGGWRKVREK